MGFGHPIRDLYPSNTALTRPILAELLVLGWQYWTEATQQIWKTLPNNTIVITGLWLYLTKQTFIIKLNGKLTVFLVTEF